MKRVCAWCGAKMGSKPPLEDKSETHTICKRCVQRYTPFHLDEAQKRKQKKEVVK